MSKGFWVTKYTPTAVGSDEVFDIEHRLAEKLIAYLIFDRKQPTLNHTDTRRRDLECQLQHALLGIVQVGNARQKQWPNVQNRDTN